MAESVKKAAISSSDSNGDESTTLNSDKGNDNCHAAELKLPYVTAVRLANNEGNTELQPPYVPAIKPGKSNDKNPQSISSSNHESDDESRSQSKSVTSSDSNSDQRNPSDPNTKTSIQKSLAFSIRDLKNIEPSDWNDESAHIVYSAFRIKRYAVDFDYILCPSYPQEMYTIPYLLERSNRIVKGTTWSQFKTNMDEVLKIFDGETYKIADGLHDGPLVQVGEDALNRNIEEMKNLPASPKIHGIQDELIQNLKAFIHRMKYSCHAGQVHLPESSCVWYFDMLVDVFRDLSGFALRAKKYNADHLTGYGLNIPSLGELNPEPDFVLVSPGFNPVAVVEVKPAERLSHKGHPVCPSTGKVNNENAISEVDGAPTEESQVLETEDDMASFTDQFEEFETLKEAAQKTELPAHVRILDCEDKKRVRCFLPQLFAQLLACSNQKKTALKYLSRMFETGRLGIGVVGLRARFVTLVIKDHSGSIVTPTAANITSGYSVRPYLYITHELNLCKREHVEIFFQVLFALGYVSAKIVSHEDMDSV